MAPRRSARDSRQLIFKAAAVEFAERGYAAAGVDRIAEKARVNKAMIYYHFGSKADLYREVLQDMFRAVSARARAIADGDGTPEAKFDTWVATLVEEAAARPHFPPIMLRELASGGEHLDPDTVRTLGRLGLKTIGALVMVSPLVGSPFLTFHSSFPVFASSAMTWASSVTIRILPCE